MMTMLRRFSITLVLFTAALAGCALPGEQCRNQGYQPGTSAYDDCIQSAATFQLRGYNNLGSHPNP
jgi:hypothetical protein